MRHLPSPAASVYFYLTKFDDLLRDGLIFNKIHFLAVMKSFASTNCSKYLRKNVNTGVNTEVNIFSTQWEEIVNPGTYLMIF